MMGGYLHSIDNNGAIDRNSRKENESPDRPGLPHFENRLSLAPIAILGLYKDNGKENGNYCIVIRYIKGLYRDMILAPVVENQMENELESSIYLRR